jgi:hypothetical protein
LGKHVNFAPKTISGSDFATTICDTLSSKIQGKKYVARAEKEEKPKD